MRPLEHMGLALASSLSAYVNLVGLAWLLSRRLGGLGGAEIMRSLARTLGASAGLGIWCVWSAPMLGGGTVGTIAALAVGAGVYGGIALAIRAPEIHDLLGMLRRRRRILP
jgi:putative peptidoglycan lipid II flippase